MKHLIIFLILIFSGCMTKNTSGVKSAPSSVNTKNLKKDPATGIYFFKSSYTNGSLDGKVSDGGVVPPRINEVKSKDLLPPKQANLQLENGGKIKPIDAVTSKPGTKEAVEPKKPLSINWISLIFYYLLVLHVALIVYIAYKRKVFEKIKNPFTETKDK